MDPYYQQGGPQAAQMGAPGQPGNPQIPQQQQLPPQAQSQQQQMSAMVGVGAGSRPSAPPLQAHQSHHGNPQPMAGQPQPQHSSHHHQSAASGGHRGYPQQQPPPPAGNPAYGQQPLEPQMQQQSQGYQRSGGGHHGGQAPLPPHHQSSSGGRYGHERERERASHRSAMMHQHRSSAAAISDPMVGITDHLASASGPMTGSGYALNQLGLSGPGGYGGGGPAGYSGYERGRGDLSGVGVPGNPIDGGYPTHQSRYDAHYGGHRSRAHTSSAGAYHLDRGDPMLAAGERGGYYPAPSQSLHHQSLGNLPSTSGRLDQRYGAADPSFGLGGQYGGYLGEHSAGRAGSMPPLDSVGLGAYNPLEDPLASHQMHQPLPGASLHHQQAYRAGDPLGMYPVGGAVGSGGSGQALVTELRARLVEAQNSYAAVKRELETATQKLGSSMHSIKSFWSPELKKERALRKEESTKYALINDQMKLMRVEVQKQALLIRQLEEELKLAHETQRIRATDPDIQQHIDALCAEKESLFKENCMLRDAIRELEMRIETQKQTLAAREDSTKKLVEMINNKGIATKIMEDERLEMDRIKSRNIDLEARLRHYETIIESKEKDLIKSPPTSSSPAPAPKQQASTSGAKSNPFQEAINLKSPKPKQRKSLGHQSASETATQVERSRLSRAERVRQKLTGSSAVANSSAGSSSNLSLSSSSGVSSSRSSELRETHADQNLYLLCDCPECRSDAGPQDAYGRQMIRSISQEPRAATPPRSSIGKKAVSFRASVEHIGSPNCRPLNDAFARMFLSDGRDDREVASAVNDSCDSLHATKDFSASLLQFEDQNNDRSHALLNGPATDAAGDNDCLRPLDCSTPKPMTHQVAAAQATSCQRRGQPLAPPADQRELIQVEVHRAEVGDEARTGSDTNMLGHNLGQQTGGINSHYTCLCSPDFMCVHNGYTSGDRRVMVAPSGSRPRPTPQLINLSNDLYGSLPRTANSSDFPLSRDCIECKNLSTYVNLSNLNPAPAQLIGDASNNVSGYDSGDYKVLLRSRQSDVYENAYASRQAQALIPRIQQPAGLVLDEPSHYLAEARRLQQTISECEMCNEHLIQSGSGALLQCSCQQRSQTGIKTIENSTNSGEQSMSDLLNSGSTSNSYHTALNMSASLRQTDPSLAIINASKLRVLPVTSGTAMQNSAICQNLHQRKTQSALSRVDSSMLQNLEQKAAKSLVTQAGQVPQMNANNNNLDSSLSSLFVYRHISDDNTNTNHNCNGNNSNCNQIECDHFDPDSLDQIQTAPQKPVKKQSRHKSLGLTSTRSEPQLKPPNGSSWLKGRPKSDYISLSSTTSSLSESKAAKSSKQATKTSNGPSAGQQVAPQATTSSYVQADVTGSSLAKRRQLSSSLQKQQQSAAVQGNKRKLLSSKSNSRSSPNLTLKIEQNATGTKSSSGHSRSSSSAGHSNVKSIYQCVKNHLKDIAGKSTSSSQQSAATGAKLPNAKKSSVSLPRGSSLTALASKVTDKSSKATQMDELRTELVRREQELLTMGAKMKALEEQNRDSQRHIRVLKDSLAEKGEHYNLLLTDVEELRRNLDERNKLIEKRSYQQTFGGLAGGGKGGASGGSHVAYHEVQELQQLLELRDKKINELQRKVMQLDNLLSDRDSQLDRARMRMEHSMAATTGAGSHQLDGSDFGLINHLEETLGDKEKQINLLRDQRDRAEHELGEERDSHERSIKEYKMKLNSVKFEMDKLQNRLSGSGGKLIDNSTSLMDSSSLVKRLEMDKRSLQLECDRLRDRLEATGGGKSSSSRFGIERASSAIGDYSVVEFERLQETLESQKQELRRAQAECRMNEMERKRAQEEADKLSERFERSQGEMHKLKAKLENAISERKQLIEDYECQQQMISKIQTERDCALADINQVKIENDRLQQQYNRVQLECEKLQNQLERAQNELRKLDDRHQEQLEELRKVQSEKAASQRELKRITVQMETNEISHQRLQQEKELSRQDLEKLRERYERLELEMDKFSHDKEMNEQQVVMYKERFEQSQQAINKLRKEKEAFNLEIHELRERLHKQQKSQDSQEHEIKSEVKNWKEKYERLLVQFEKLNDDMAAKQKESQLIVEKFQRYQNETVKLESRLEQSEIDRERMAIELERQQQIVNKYKDDQDKWQEESQSLQEMYTKTNTKLLKLTEVEERLRIEFDKCQMDLEVLRERYDKLQGEARKLQSERDRLQVEYERVLLDLQQGTTPGAKAIAAQGGQPSQGGVEELQRLNSELERSLVKLEQYQREINKLQLEKERLLLDSKASLQKTEQQFQQQVLKIRSNEEKLAVELERAQAQLEKVQSEREQTSVDQEKLFADKERLKQQLLLLQQEVDKFRKQQNNSAEETRRLHEDEMQRVLQELETIREKYTQQRKELLQLRELQQNHEIEKDMFKRELESAESRLEKLNRNDAKQREDSERCAIELEKMKDIVDRKQQELIRAQQERNQFAQEITVLHKQVQQLQVEYEQLQKQQQSSGGQQQPQQPQQQQQQTQQQPQIKSDEINKLKQILVKSEQELQKATAENQRFQMEVERLKLQLDDAAEYIGRIESSNKSLQKKNQEILQQANQIQNQQASGANQQQQQQQQQQMVQLEVERLKQDNKNMQEVIKKSASEIQRLVEERNKLQEVTKELQRSIEKTKVDFTSTIEQYEAELTRLQQEAQQKNQQQQNQPQPQQQAASDEYKVKFEKAVEAIRAFQKSSDDMKKEIFKLNEVIKNLKDQNQKLVDALKSTEDKLKVTDNQQQPQSGSKEAEEMRKQVSQLSELCRKLEGDLQKTGEETQRHLQSNQQLKQALDKSQSELSTLKTERDRFQNQLEKLMVELEHREAEMTKLQQKQNKSAQTLQAKQNELAAAQKQLEEREKALEAKRNELQQQQPNQQQQQPQTQQQQEVIAKLQQQIKSLEEERNKLKTELERIRNELKQSQAELERLLQILSSSEEEKFNLTRQIEQLQAKLKSQPNPQQAGPSHQQQPPPPPRGQPQGQPQQPKQGLQQQQRPPAQPQQQRPGAGQQQQRPPQQGQQNPLPSLLDSMDLLEVALKDSIDWSMNKRRTSTSDQKTLSAVEDGVELMNRRLSDESHVRAFISHFKIKLNNLMGYDLIRASTSEAVNELDISQATTDDDEESFSDNYSFGSSCNDEGDDDTGITMPSVRLQRRNHKIRSCESVPSIRINGKYFGLYKINEHQSDDIDQELVRLHSIGLPKNQARKCESLREGCLRATHNHQDELVDDGYRSMSRASHHSNLIQQLGDIKSRLIDLVHELDQIARSRLSQEEIEAYRRRRDALLSRIDSLIESSLQKDNDEQIVIAAHLNNLCECLTSDNEHSQSNSPSSSAAMYRQSLRKINGSLHKNSSESKLHSDNYEEQVHVIDYDLEHRRASDLSSSVSSTCSPGRGAANLVSNMICVTVGNSHFGYMEEAHSGDSGTPSKSDEERQNNCNSSKEAAGSNDSSPKSNNQHAASDSTASSSSRASSSSFL